MILPIFFGSCFFLWSVFLHHSASFLVGSRLAVPYYGQALESFPQFTHPSALFSAPLRREGTPWQIFPKAPSRCYLPDFFVCNTHCFPPGVHFLASGKWLCFLFFVDLRLPISNPAPYQFPCRECSKLDYLFKPPNPLNIYLSPGSLAPPFFPPQSLFSVTSLTWCSRRPFPC